MATITLAGTETTFTCEAGDTIMRAALRAGLGFPYECNVGSCGNCRFELIAGAVAHARGTPAAWSARDGERNRYIGCQAVANSDCTIKVRLDQGCISRYRPRHTAAQLIGVSDVSHDIRAFRFRLAEPRPFLAGQYALYHLPGLETDRAYSMANAPGAGDIWECMVRRVPGGAGTAVLFDALRPGDSVTVDGPYGMAYFRPEVARDIVCMAGGSGLGPMLAIAREAAHSGALATRQLHFFYGGRTPRDLSGAERVKTLPGFGESLFAHTAISEPDNPDSAGWAGPTGFIHEVARDTLGAALGAHEIYFAGPPAMGEAIQTLLFRELKIPAAQVHFDQFY